MEKKTIGIDFDGVIHSYKSGWEGVEKISDIPVENVEWALSFLKDSGYEIIVWSTRCAYVNGNNAIKDYLAKWGILKYVDKIVAVKPPCLCYIDDRAITFTGDWLKTVNDILDFKSYIDREKELKEEDHQVKENFEKILEKENDRIKKELLENKKVGENINGKSN